MLTFFAILLIMLEFLLRNYLVQGKYFQVRILKKILTNIYLNNTN